MVSSNGNEVGMHAHTTRSDGSESIEDLFLRAKSEKVKALCKTDHDTLSGANEARELAVELGIETMLASEVSAFFQTRFGNILFVHILGYGYEPGKIEKAEKAMESNREAVNDLSLNLIKRLNIDLEIALTVENVRNATGASGPCIYPWQIIHAAAGETRRSIDSINRKYVQSNGMLVPEEFYSDKRVLDALSAVQAIRESGGKAVLAHPGLLYSMRWGSCEHAYEEFLALLKLLVDHGLSGIETFHSCHTPNQQTLFSEIAKRFNLKQTAGSDSHGTYRPYPIGMPGMTYKEFLSFKAFCQSE